MMDKQRRARGEGSKSSKADAGRKSGASRRLRGEWRRLRVLKEFEQLPAPNRGQPFSDDTLDTLLSRLNPKPSPTGEMTIAAEGAAPRGERLPSPSETWWKLFDEYFEHQGADIPNLEHYNRETVIKDLKALRIRTKHKASRSG